MWGRILNGLPSSKSSSSLYQVLPGQHLLVPGHQRKHKNNGWNMFKVSNKDRRAMPMLPTQRAAEARIDYLCS